MDGLSILAQEVLRQDPLSGSLFVFVNARRNKLKILVWKRNGFVVWYQAARAASLSLATRDR